MAIVMAIEVFLLTQKDSIQGASAISLTSSGLRASASAMAWVDMLEFKLKGPFHEGPKN